MPSDLDRLDRAVVNAFQGGFPVTEWPFKPAATALREHGIEVSADELARRIRRLDEEGTITRFGPLVNAEAIGGTATLVAMHAPDTEFDEIVDQVNARREVAHNYERGHEHLNVWFVISVADPERVPAVLKDIENETGQTTYNMPKQREFRVEAKFPVDGPLAEASIDLSTLGPTVTPTNRTTITPAERDLLLAIQDGLPLTTTPYQDVADDLNGKAETSDRDSKWVIRTVKRLVAEGKIRRIGIVPNHYALGYSENGMTVWDVPDEAVGDVGSAVASLPFVTHCYERPRHDEVWPFNFFAMVHGRNEDESRERIERVREVMADHWNVSDDDWSTLFSTRILKKTGIRLGERAAANVEVEGKSD